MGVTTFSANVVVPVGPAGPDLWLAMDSLGEAMLAELRDVVARDRTLTATCRLLSVTDALAAGSRNGHETSAIATAFDAITALRGEPIYHTAGTITPHIWVPCDLVQDTPEVIPRILAGLASRLAENAIPFHIFLVTRLFIDGADGERRRMVRGCAAAVLDWLAGPGKPGHGRTTVFVATDRDARGAHYAPAECQETLVRFAELMLLGNPLRANAGPVASLLSLPVIASDDSWGGLPVFAALGVRVGEYPARQQQEDHQARQLPALLIEVRRPPGLQWSPDVPSWTPIDVETTLPTRQLTSPAWSPDLWRTPRQDFARARKQFDDWQIAAAAWQRQKLVDFAEGRRRLPEETAAQARQYQEQLDHNISDIFRRTGLPGLFPLIDGALGRAVDELTVSLRELDGAAPPFLADDEEPVLPDLAAVPRDSKTVLARALARRVNMRLALIVAIVSAAISWLFIMRGLHQLDTSLVADVDRLAARQPWLPTVIRDQLHEWHHATLIDWLPIRVWSAVGVVGVTAIALWLTALRTRAKLTGILGSYRRRTVAWRRDVADIINRELQAVSNRAYRTEVEPLIAALEERRRQLADLDTAMHDLPWTAAMATSRITAELTLGTVTPEPELRPDAVHQAIVNARQTLPPDLHNIDAPGLATRLSAAADELTGWSPPTLARDRAAFRRQLPELLPRTADVLALVTPAGDRQLFATMVSLLGVPAELVAEAAELCPNPGHLIVRIADANAVYAAQIQYWLTAADLLGTNITASTMTGGAA